MPRQTRETLKPVAIPGRNRLWLIGSLSVLELSSLSSDSFVELSCIQLYNRVLPQADISLVKDRCFVLGKSLPLSDNTAVQKVDFNQVIIV